MNQGILIILLILIPSLIVFLTALYVLHSMNERHLKEIRLLRNDDIKNTFLPLKIQAYERLALFLERIAPEQLLAKMSKEDAENLTTLHQYILDTIRQEYEYNLSQQIYVSRKAWLSVISAKEEIIQIINQAFNEAHSSYSEFAVKIFELYLKKDVPAIKKSLDLLRSELNREVFYLESEK
ncbi:MAG: hypothetical protein WBL11_01210 [Bacteroidales bacterium]|jgi:hypothetical protein|nr:hypothetical protein [Bacteroidales bacterium]MDI9575989.1 hypothetical protein [Bacteroidota bacterium]MDD2592919.1 hypothetical protein [Bacteroidales bacterium]MDD3755009.1 hypothetical protein [Bacteroidales bacterium]MDY0400199.1 hypothetical protein [Bacteroidales bacterium]